MGRIRVKPLTRVEGHGEIELVLDRGSLVDVRSLVTESPRLFESMLVGRDLFEVPALICRICAICSSVHRVVACQALEKALGIAVPTAAEKVRELLLLGGHMESHALHLFCLILPDLSGRSSLLDLLRDGDGTALAGLELKALANRIQTLAGGRVIHPVNVEVGGVLRLPERSEMEKTLEDVDPWLERLEELILPFFEADRYPPSTCAQGMPIAVRTPTGSALTGENLALGDGRTVAAKDYRQVLAEEVGEESNAKQSRYRGAPLLAGALARRALGTVDGPAPETAGLPGGIHGNNAAQASEMLWALRRCRELIEELLRFEPGPLLARPPAPSPGTGIAAIEAPRGLLVHHYVVDDRGRIAAADIITPTAINQASIEAQILCDLRGTTDRSALIEGAQRIVRSFDPCISCSVHLLETSAPKNFR